MVGHGLHGSCPQKDVENELRGSYYIEDELRGSFF